MATSLGKRVQEVMPGGVNSPIRSCRGYLPEPFIVERGVGDLLFDLDGKSYIDYCGSWGPLIHGHAHPEILQAASEAMQKGTTFGITNPYEEKLASKIIHHIPSIELIRFVSSGTEATMTAIRLARGFTGRNQIIKFIGHYHGHSDMLLVKAGSGVSSLPESSSAGVTPESVKHTLCLPFNDIEAVRQAITEETAAVILEPIAANMGVVPPTPAFIEMLRERTKEVGALLIFDEVITGFRVGLSGAQGLFGIKPDLTTLGKIMGGGFNAAAFGGRRDVMEKLAPLGPVYQAGTLSGNPVAMAAGLKAIELLERTGFYEELERKTDLLTNPIQKWLQGKRGVLQQQGSLFTIFLGVKQVNNFSEAMQVDLKTYQEFFRELFQKGIYIPPHPQEAWFVSMAHTKEHLDYSQEAILTALSRLIKD